MSAGDLFFFCLCVRFLLRNKVGISNNIKNKLRVNALKMILY